MDSSTKSLASVSNERSPTSLVGSHSDWYGELPSHWSVDRGKTFMQEINERSVDGSETLLSVTEKEGVVRREEVIDEGDHLSRAESLEGYKKCDAGDLVVNIMLAWKRGLGVANEPGIASPAYAVFRPDPEKMEPGYLDYMIRADEVVRLIKTFSYGVVDSRLRIYPDRLLALPFPRPPTREQKTIAHFLDRKTSRIDRLIAKKERLIELLKEKRTALITQAVTKGLDPDVPMKDSGVEWLGEIPEHWQTVRLGRIAQSIQTGPFGSQLHAKDYERGSTPVVNPTNLLDRSIDPDWEKTVGPQVVGRLSRHRLQLGDLVLARRGNLGACGLATDSEEGWLCGTGCIRVRPRQSLVRSDFLSFTVTTRGVAEWMELESVGSTMSNLNTSIVARIPLVIPPKDEQRNIARELYSELDRMAEVESRIEDAVDTLQEYRSALITAAVTGKIDVRDRAA